MYYQMNEISFELPMETILTLMIYSFLLTELRVLVYRLSSIVYRLATFRVHPYLNHSIIT